MVSKRDADGSLIDADRKSYRQREMGERNGEFYNTQRNAEGHGIEDDDEIRMPDERHAGSEDSSSDDSDGIVMPEGPPPSRIPILRPLPGEPPLPIGPPPITKASNMRSHPSHIQDQSHIIPTQPRSQRIYHNSNKTHQNHSAQPSHPGPPPKPPSAVISAEPVLRDFKKESTTFVPNAIRKKQAAEKAKATKSGLPNIVNAAPGASQDRIRENETGLMNSIQSHLDQRTELNPSNDAQKDEYKQFLGDIQDLL